MIQSFRDEGTTNVLDGRATRQARLTEEFLKPLEISQRNLADGIHVPYQRVNELINRRRGITPSTALRLAKYFGNSAGFWLSLQYRWDLYFAMKAEDTILATIRPVQANG